MELLVTNSPFQPEQCDLLNRLIPALTETQRIWLSGYLSGLQSGSAQSVAQAPLSVNVAEATTVSKEVTILFGSQTGNAQRLAKKLSQQLEASGFQPTLSSMNDFKTANLKKIQNLFIVVSTYGEGEPPDQAASFYEFLQSKRAPKLEGLNFSVLSLGDTSYEFFCKTGKDFDKRLEELGAKRLVPRVDCDVDFEESATAWMKQVIETLSDASSTSAATSVIPTTGTPPVTSVEYSRSKPFSAEVLENINLNGRGSEKETRHIEISLEGSNLRYEPGDSLGIYPENHPQLVEDLIAAMNWKSDELVPLKKEDGQASLGDSLRAYFDITLLNKSLLEQIAALSGNSKLQDLLQSDREALKEYITGRDLLDVVRDFDLKGIPAAEFVTALRKLAPRLYSISSSPKATPDEVHVTVRSVRYNTHGRDRYGVCSVHLAERSPVGAHVPVFIQQNPNFKLPDHPDAPIIMVGPGTGVAPFRAFMMDRAETGATGKSWLFFGDQRFRTDFLYQLEWQRLLKEGVLTHLDVAFSRDTDQKVYVQHRILEKGPEIYQWLQEGAYFYVCGDAKLMATDVQNALIQILEQEGKMSNEQALEYLQKMKQEKRYQRDVY